MHARPAALQVPANRISYGPVSLAQLEFLQDVITLTVFAPFAVYYMKQPLKLDYLWASLCILGAEYFMFRGYRLASMFFGRYRKFVGACLHAQQCI